MDKLAVIRFLERYVTEKVLANHPPSIGDSHFSDRAVFLQSQDDLTGICLVVQEVDPLFAGSPLPFVDLIPGHSHWNLDFRAIVDDFAFVTSSRETRGNDLTLYEFLLSERSFLEAMGVSRFEMVDSGQCTRYQNVGEAIEAMDTEPPVTIEFLLREIERVDKGSDPEIALVAKKNGRAVSR